VFSNVPTAAHYENSIVPEESYRLKHAPTARTKRVSGEELARHRQSYNMTNMIA